MGGKKGFLSPPQEERVLRGQDMYIMRAHRAYIRKMKRNSERNFRGRRLLTNLGWREYT